MNIELTTILCVVSVSSIFLILAIYRVLSYKKMALADRLKIIETTAAPKQTKENMPLNSNRLLVILSVISQRALKFNLFKKIANVVDKDLTAADIPLKSEEFVLLTLAASLLGGFITAAILKGFLAGLFVAVLIVLSANILLKTAKTKRIRKYNSQIGDALVIMSNSLRSGFSLLQSMDMVRKELPPPISKEFGRTFQEMSLGISTEEALSNLNARVKSEDMDLVITAVLIQRQVGGNLAEILDNIANTIRERVRIKGEIRTLTAQGKISGVIIGVLPILLGVAMSAISPNYLKTLTTHPVGKAMLLIAVIKEVIGILLIRRIIDIKV